MLIIELLELIGVFCGIYFSLILFPWVSVIFFKKKPDLIVENQEQDDTLEDNFSYIIYLGEYRKINPRINNELNQELEIRGILGTGRVSNLKEKILKFDDNIDIKKIRKSYSNKSFQDVINNVNNRLKIYSKDEELCILLIRSHFAEENYYQCIDVCDDLIELDENNITALRFIARSHSKLNNQKKAAEFYSLISEIFPEDLDSRIMLMRFYFKEKQHEKTIIICEQILSFDKGNIEAEKFIARSSLILGNKEKTLKKFLEIVEKQPEDIESKFSLVNFYYNEKDFENCIKWCEEVLFIDRDNFKAWKLISRSHIKNERIDLAEESLLKMIELQPNELETYTILIRYYYSEKDYENCIKICNNLLKQDEFNLEAMRFKTRSNEKLGKEEVIEGYLEIAVRNIKDVDSRLKIMRHYYNKKEYENCIKICNEIIEIKGERNDVLNILSRSYFNLQENKKAKQNILKLLNFEPNNLKYLLLAIRTSFNEKEYEDSIIFCEQYLAINDSDLVVQRILARSHHNLGNEKIAEQMLYDLISKDPKDIESRITLIRNNYTSGNYDTVHKLCDEILKKKKSNRIALLFHARAYTAAREFEKAIEAWEFVLKKYKNDTEALSGAGRAFYNDGKTELAREYLERALKTSPDSVQIKRSLSLVYLRQKEWDLAIPILEEECKRKPLEFINWERRINLLHEMNREDDAKKCLNEIIEYIDDEPEALFMAFAISKSYYWTNESDYYLKNATKYLDEENSTDLIIKFVKYYLEQGDLTQSLNYQNIGFEKTPNSEKLLEIKADFIDLLNSIETPIQIIENALVNEETVLITECVIRSIFNKTKTQVKEKWSNNNKLAMISSSLNRGGAERQVVSCLEGLSKSNKFVKTKLFCYAIDNSGGTQETYGEEVNSFNIPIIEFGRVKNWTEGYSNAEELLKPWESLLRHLNSRLRREIEPMFLNFLKYKPSIVHTWQDTTNILTGLAAAMAGVPKVLMFGRSLRPDGKTMLHMRNKPYLKESYRALLSSDRFTLCLNSEAGAKSYSEWLNIPIEKLKVLHNGTDFSGIEEVCKGRNITEKLQEFGISDEHKVVGSVFRFVMEKRPFLWVKTAKEILQEFPDIHFVLIGGGGLFEAVRLEIQKENLSHRIHLVGQTNLVKLWLDRMDLFLMTSKIEGLPNVLIEAQGFGVPVISTNAGGANETFIDGETGILVNNPEATIIAKEVTKKLFNNEWLKLASKKSSRNAREKFDKNSMFNNLCNIYDDL